MTKRITAYEVQLRKERLGEGWWRRSSDGAAVEVDVCFYPKLQRYITEDGERRRISAEDLERDYRRERIPLTD
jgi:hypothetical protein